MNEVVSGLAGATTAADKIDKATRDVLFGINDSIDRSIKGVTPPLETANQIADQANQIVESLPTNHRSYVVRYIPRVLPPAAQDSFQVRIRGVNLHRADPKLIVADESVRRSQSSALEAEFTVSMEKFEPDQHRMKIETLNLTYLSDPDGFFKRMFGGKETVHRQINIVHLPVEVAQFHLVAHRQYEHRETDSYRNSMGQFEGRKQRVYKVAKPPQDWKWDLTKPPEAFKTVQGQGVAGRCEGVEWNNSTEEGLRYRARVEERGSVLDRRPGYVNCTIEGPVYRTVPVKEAYPVKADSAEYHVLTWTKDVQIDLPPHTKEVSLTFGVFDQRTRVINNSGSDKFFTVQRSPDSVLVAPIIPKDLML
ncbi:hypothetical protein [Marinobacter sp. DY40_1A1]|uniref:hypothetical protein n=1 Tax=Marinobacter sp. DY40_1A1 TaxID=2583229 RepID=UPI0019066EBE|nr:hypothetical protein [Marinobacter sp. DY40_1A1]MBK1888390.1 hypothetical protein [Marinobacter sp. DY40_1A1]